MKKIKKVLKVKCKLNGRTIKTSYKKFQTLKEKHEKKADFTGEKVNVTGSN